MDPSVPSPQPGTPGATAQPASPTAGTPNAANATNDCAPTTTGTAPGPLPAPSGPGFDATRQAIGLSTPAAYAPPSSAYPPQPVYPYPAPYPPPYGTPYPYPSPPPPYGSGGNNIPPPPGPKTGGGGGGNGGGLTGMAEHGLFGESFFMHIDELRKRVLRCVLALIIAACLVSFFMQELNRFVQEPMESQRRALCEKMLDLSLVQKGEDDDQTRIKYEALMNAEKDPAELDRLKMEFQAEMRWNEIQLESRRVGGMTAGKIRAKGPVGPFTYLVDLILYTSILLAAPYWLWEMWGFVSPALYQREKMAIAPVFLFGLVLFLIGATFGYLYVLPISFNYLMDLGMWLDFEPWYDVGEYFSFCFMVTICFGLSFELPLVCIMLGKLGFLSHNTLIKYWKWMIFGAFLLAGILTPPDVMSQIMMAAVLIVLYLISIVGVYFVYPRDPVK